MMPGLLRPISVETERVCLREMQVDDAEYWFRFMNLPAIQEFLPDRFETMEDIRRILAWLVSNYDKDIDRMVRITLSIHTKQWGDGPIGFVSFGPLPEDETRREIAYAMHPEWWGNGIATEAIRVFIPWIRSHITRIPLYASVDERNEASIRVLEKCGFTPASTRAGTGEKCGDGRLLFRLE